ncbi:hypothetical protein RI578_14790 [Streptomyces sp. BB1-1-1]|uniref:hypothetical protein n=1 Tax=Streptomyces sp. BB1-1-1 TaxID=3074430 RepID=UPI002877C864|nr:hypothetical protein [Streptomyces sp. BB1-1-1]WND35482.1 hypothetical protein RI578_14790 [Streptomyces sp. BB1-1-1]
MTIPTKDKLVAKIEALGVDPKIVRSQDTLSLDQLLAFQALYQNEYADNAVSFTANVPEGLNADEVAETIRRWLPDLKGTTIMVDGTRTVASGCKSLNAGTHRVSAPKPACGNMTTYAAVVYDGKTRWTGSTPYKLFC